VNLLKIYFLMNFEMFLAVETISKLFKHRFYLQNRLITWCDMAMTV